MKNYLQMRNALLLPLMASADYAAAGAAGPVVTWEPLTISSVPSLSTWAVVMLSVLVAILALRGWRESPNVLRSLLVLAMAGSAAGGVLWVDRVNSSALVVPTNTCEGSHTVNSSTELENNCGETVVLTVQSCPTDYELICYNTAVECAQSGDTLPNGSTIWLPNCSIPRD